MPGFFVTATGTDIGKTFVTAGLIKACRLRGMGVSALKPVVSGFDESDPAGSDPALLLEALGKPLTSAQFDLMSPWRFRAPLSPDMAARKEARSIDFDVLVTHCLTMITACSDVLLIEGVGGVMVPLNTQFTTLDLMERLDLPVILVTGTYLGAISHLLSALDALRTRNLLPRVIVMNESEGSQVTVQDTLETLSQFCGGLPIIPIARQTAVTPRSAGFESLIEALNIV